MPNRILKDSICLSDSIDILTPNSEILFYRLIVQCDDFGRLDARPSIVRSKCYPLRIDKISDSDISKSLIELVTNDLINVYKNQGKFFIQITTWRNHQQVRAKNSKFPEPEETLSKQLALDYYCKYMISVDINSKQPDINSKQIDNGNQLQSNDINCTRNRKRNTIDDNTISDIRNSVSKDTVEQVQLQVDTLNELKNSLTKEIGVKEKVAFLGNAFKKFHVSAVNEHEGCYGRIGNLLKKYSYDYDYILSAIYKTQDGIKTIEGSHLNYIEKLLQGNNGYNPEVNNEPPVSKYKLLSAQKGNQNDRQTTTP